MKGICTLFLVLLTATCFGQDFRYGKVSKEELEKKVSTIDTEAAAEILYANCDWTLGYASGASSVFQRILVKTFHSRVKIYHKDKVEEYLLEPQIRYYTGVNRAHIKVTSFKAQTFNLKDGKVVKEEVNKDNVFKEKVGKYAESMKFSFPDVQDGSVLEFYYVIEDPIDLLPGRYFIQGDYPVLYSEYRFSRPEFMFCQPDIRGSIMGETTQSKEKETADLDYLQDITRIVFKNVKPIREEPFVLNVDNLRGSIGWNLVGIYAPGLKKVDLSSTWDQVGKYFMENEMFGKQFDHTDFVNSTTTHLVQNLTDSMAMARAIFNFVRDSIDCDDYDDAFAYKDIKKTLKEKSGNNAELNLLLVAMLRSAGFQADPVISNTVKNLILNPTVPVAIGLSNVITYVTFNGESHLMDPSGRYSKIDMLPFRDRSQIGYRVKQDGTTNQVSILPSTLSATKDIIDAELTADGKLTGSFTEMKDNDFAMEDRDKRRDDSLSFGKEYLKAYNFDVDEFHIEENAQAGTMKYSFKFENPTGVEALGNKIILNPMLFLKTKYPSYNSEKRDFPLEFGAVTMTSKTIRIKIPEGYKLYTMPQNKAFVLPDTMAGCSYRVEEKFGYIILTTVFEVEKSILPASYYPLMRQLEAEQLNAENQQLVLVRNDE